MEGLRLVSPDSKYQNQYLDFIRECTDDIQTVGMYHYMPLSNEASFENDINILINKGKGIGLPEGWVPTSTYWLMDENFSHILGALNIRHSLTDYLRFRGGHIAYYIHRHERKKGYASKMLSLGLEICREMGIERVLITCAKSNIGSARTIINNGGILHSEDFDDNEQFQRYCIERNI
jgi:predicted acetyltransferase